MAPEKWPEKTGMSIACGAQDISEGPLSTWIILYTRKWISFD